MSRGLTSSFKMMMMMMMFYIYKKGNIFKNHSYHLILVGAWTGKVTELTQLRCLATLSLWEQISKWTAVGIAVASRSPSEAWQNEKPLTYLKTQFRTHAPLNENCVIKMLSSVLLSTLIIWTIQLKKVHLHHSKTTKYMSFCFCCTFLTTAWFNLSKQGTL